METIAVGSNTDGCLLVFILCKNGSGGIARWVLSSVWDSVLYVAGLYLTNEMEGVL